MTNVNRTYRDLSLSFSKNAVTGDIATISNHNAISQSIKNIVLTNFEERPFLPSFGSNVTNSLFDNFDQLTEQRLQEFIISSIENNEPRAIVQRVDVEANEDYNTLTVTIIYSTLNSLDPIQVEVFLERIR